MMEKFQQIYTERAWRSVREIVLAIVLTLAAAAFLVAALSHRANETAAVKETDTIEQPATN
jgi:hypothetical protein